MFNRANIDQTCVICHDGVFSSDACITHCKHIFHRDCLNQWCEISASNDRRPRCPTCRSEVYIIADHTRMIVCKYDVATQREFRKIAEYFEQIYRRPTRMPGTLAEFVMWHNEHLDQLVIHHINLVKRKFAQIYMETPAESAFAEQHASDELFIMLKKAQFRAWRSWMV